MDSKDLESSPHALPHLDGPALDGPALGAPRSPIRTPEAAPSSGLRLRGADLAELVSFMERAGHPAYRARQIFQWVYQKGAQDFEGMTNLPKELRAWLRENVALGGMRRIEIVGRSRETQKIVFQTDDGEFVESVLMRDEDDADGADGADGAKARGTSIGRGAGAAPPVRPPARNAQAARVSLCVSSQIGCPLNCRFCLTGFGGFRRDLRVDEITGQLIEARRVIAPDERIASVVFMGMGEPMLNLRAVIPALDLYTSPEALDVPGRRITVSTAGVVPGIDELARSGVEANLAVSLNATTQETRDRAMPALRKWPIPELLDACRRFPLSARRRITFEYVLLDGVNDAPADARRLIRLLHGIPSKVNLICYNPDDRLGFRPANEEKAEAFRAALSKANYAVSLRRSKGRRYQAACGQLAAHFTRGK